jgi:hypothetical protein
MLWRNLLPAEHRNLAVQLIAIQTELFRLLLNQPLFRVIEMWETVSSCRQYVSRNDRETVRESCSIFHRHVPTASDKFSVPLHSLWLRKDFFSAPSPRPPFCATWVTNCCNVSIRDCYILRHIFEMRTGRKVENKKMQLVYFEQWIT